MKDKTSPTWSTAHSVLTLGYAQLASQGIALPEDLPAPGSVVSGDWARFITQTPFQFATGMHGQNLRGQLLERLLKMAPVNEPVIRERYNNFWNVDRFFNRINASLTNVEAAVMQCVGEAITDPDEMCKHCRGSCGPFAFCVRVEGVKHCANCHWERFGHRCSFNTKSTKPWTPKPKPLLKSKPPVLEAIKDQDKEISDLRTLKAEITRDMRSFQNEFLEGADERCVQAFDKICDNTLDFFTRMKALSK
ncbi:hypothetical protein N7454_008641 [Penicillium verhagenii]|nr:hypothetical protein N7454_008641 [Penicillium verhagenii]